VKNDVGWLSDVVPESLVVPTTIGTIGWGLGLQGTTNTKRLHVRLGERLSARGHDVHAALADLDHAERLAATTCPGLTTQDEHAAFNTAFCQ